MLAYGAKLGSLRTNYDMSAVAALPDLYAALFKYGLRLYVIEKCAVSLLVRLLDSRNAAHLLSKVVEALLVSLARHSVVHIRPLVVLALCCGDEVFCRRSKSAESLEPKLCVLLFVFCGLKEKLCYLLVARLLCNRCKIRVPTP